jgi:V8-like Glu-specific endopeptidase
MLIPQNFHARRITARWAAAALVAVGIGITTGTQSAGAAGAVGTTQGPATDLAAYWTPARMAAAVPLEAPAKGTPAKAAAAVAAPAVDNTYDGPYPGEFIPPSNEFNGTPQAGTFFWTDAAGTGRTCSGSVVQSPHRNLVLSAGHCLKGYAGPNPAKNLAFIPGYHDGLTPYGVFPVQTNGIYVSPQYYALGVDAGAEYDFAFAVTLPNASGRTLESAIGRPGYTLLTNTGYFHAPVHMIGYPGGASHTKPIECWSYTTQWNSTDPADPGSYPRIPCTNFIGGTSGGPLTVPWLAPSGFAVVGVIGGVHTGGNTDSISYSAYFGDATRALYDAAVAGAPPAQP